MDRCPRTTVQNCQHSVGILQLKMLDAPARTKTAPWPKEKKMLTKKTGPNPTASTCDLDLWSYFCFINVFSLEISRYFVEVDLLHFEHHFVIVDLLHF